jgi:hypothetical protein
MCNYCIDYGVIDFTSQNYLLKEKQDSKYVDAYEEDPIETTVGRILFNDILPEDYPYVNDQFRQLINQECKKYIDDTYNSKRN